MLICHVPVVSSESSISCWCFMFVCWCSFAMSLQCQRSRRSSLSKKRPDRPASISARRSKWRQPFPSRGSSSSPRGQLPPMPWAASLLSLRTSRSGLKEPTQRWSFSVGAPVFEASQLWWCESMGWRCRPGFVQSLKFWEGLGKQLLFLQVWKMAYLAHWHFISWFKRSAFICTLL